MIFSFCKSTIFPTDFDFLEIIAKCKRPALVDRFQHTYICNMYVRFFAIRTGSKKSADAQNI